MSDIEGEIFSSSGQSPTTPAVGITPAKDSNARPHGDMLKMMNPTPNGYSSVPNHKPKSEGQDVVKKHHEGKNSIDHHKHSSDHVKKKDEDSSKHKSSHSKPKDSSKEGKIEHREGHSDKEKKHKDSSHKDSSKSKDGGNKHSDHSKHSSSVKKEDKHKSDSIKKEHHNSDGKPKTDNFKENEKVKDSSSKEGKSKEHKDKHKDKHRDKEHKEKHKDKSSSDKPKERSDKPKEKSDKIKEKSDKPKEKSDKPKEKSDKPKEKSDKPKEKSDRPKDESHEKHKEKHKEKHGEKYKEKHKHGEKHKDKVKSKEESEKSVKCVPAKDLPSEKLYIKEETMSDEDIPLAERHASILANKSIKREAEDSEDEPISSRMEKKVKSEKKKKKSQSDDVDYEMEEKPKKRKKPASDEDDDYDTKKPAKKVKKEKTALKVKKQEPVIKRETGTPAAPKKRGKKEEESEDVWKWWEEEKLEDGVKWKTLQHNGPVFAPAYERVPKDVKFYYDGKHMPLSELTEEVAGFYGRMLDHDYTGKKVFNTNFFKDWKKVMTPEERETITDLSKCNFKDFDVYYKMKSEERKNRSKEEKAAEKAENEELTKKYGFCIIDGHKQKIGNFKIEPPGLFRGRGEHPKMGMLKRRVEAEDISINIGKEAEAPKPPPGHKWKEVRHDNTVSWLASWSENILGSTKYIMLNPSSKLKGEKDWQKYETARKLKAHANRIREEYTRDFKSKEMKVRQRAVALYFIDKLALRAGNEKDEDTADTVGCCSLRFEHITLDEEKDGQEFVVTFDFLGKDSIRYFNSVAVDKRVYKNIKLFMENKHKGDDLFDRLNTAILNKYLNDLMEGLTAKVFRTYNASKTLQEQLDLLTKEDMSLPEKILAYNRANRAVAILCNHQRAVPKGFSKSMENLKSKMDEKENQIQECKKELKSAKAAAKNGGSKDKILFDKKKKRLAQLEEQLKKLEVQATDREENKQIALGTSKLNYLDPRISVAWCKKWEVPIEKIYNRTQRDKFRWAIEMAGPDYKF